MDYQPPASTSTPATKPSDASRASPAARSRRTCCRRSAPSAGCSASRPRASREPVLVASADGVGTKLKLAFLAGRHDTVGAGPREPLRQRHPRAGRAPLFFLDYLATGRLAPDGRRADRRRAWRARAARTAARCSAARPRRCPASTPTASTTSPASSSARRRATDASTGRTLVAGRRPHRHPLDRAPHQRLLARAAHRVRHARARRSTRALPGLGATVGDALLAPHRSYLPALAPLLDRQLVKGLAHITGGGITDNLPRMLPDGLAAEIDLGGVDRSAALRVARRGRRRPARRCYRTFNMGMGLLIVVARDDEGGVLAQLQTRARPAPGASAASSTATATFATVLRAAPHAHGLRATVAETNRRRIHCRVTDVACTSPLASRVPRTLILLPFRNSPQAGVNASTFPPRSSSR